MRRLVFGYTVVTRAQLVWMTWMWRCLLRMALVVPPEMILRWHRSGFKAFWRWTSRNRVARPKIDRGLRDLIQRMSKENPLWGATRIHCELLTLGFEVRTHRFLSKDAPTHRTAQRVGSITARPILGGLRHQYLRI
jgi:hypothetical protein